MATHNPTIVKLLPVSNQPLVAFDSLTRVRRKVLQSVAVTMPPQHLPTDPSAHLFQPPIQVVVLGIDDKQVELGVYADPFLMLQQGPPPDRQWIEHWKKT